jgi:CheY-like chemotaxis protein
MLLANRTIVLVDPDVEGAAVVAAELRRAGARCLVAGSAEMAAWAVHETLPDALVAELRLPDGDAHELLARLRGAPECAAMSSLGLTSEGALAAEGLARSAGYDKYLLKPAPATDVAESLGCAIGLRRALGADLQVSAEGIPDLVERAEYGLLLRALNADSGYRYTAFLRLRTPALHSVWTFDREHPRFDRWPIGLGAGSTPCGAVLATRAPLVLEDAEDEPRLPAALRHVAMRAFAGVPLLDDEQRVVSILCHFSPTPVPADRAVRERLE